MIFFLLFQNIQKVQKWETPLWNSCQQLDSILFIVNCFARLFKKPDKFQLCLKTGVRVNQCIRFLPNVSDFPLSTPTPIPHPCLLALCETYNGEGSGNPDVSGKWSRSLTRTLKTAPSLFYLGWCDVLQCITFLQGIMYHRRHHTRRNGQLPKSQLNK